MTKHIVADGALGLLSRKQWEIQRRVLEGTLEPDEVCRKLQRIIEGAPQATLPIEEINYTVGKAAYNVRVTVTKSIVEAVRAQASAFAETFLDNDNVKKGIHCYEADDCRPRVHNRRFRLAQLDKETPIGVIRTQADIRGHILADEWDLLAFTQQAPVMRVIHHDMVIHALNGGIVRDYWTAEGTSVDAGKRTRNTLDVIGRTHGHGQQGWRLCTDAYDDSHTIKVIGITDVIVHKLSKGSYLLLRDK